MDNVEKIENGIEAMTGWQDETEARANAFGNFFRKYTSDERIESDKKRRYSSTEFHISGAGLTFEMRKGEVLPDEIRVLYEGGEVKKIHVNYRKPHSTDIYLDNRALEDFLKS